MTTSLTLKEVQDQIKSIERRLTDIRGDFVPGGEANIGANIGAGGVGPYNGKVGVQLQFRNINAGSGIITVALDAPNNEIDIDVDPSQIDLGDLGNVVIAGPANGEILTYVNPPGQWQNQPAPGGVTGPGASTDHAIVRWNGIGGNVIQDSDSILLDSGFLGISCSPSIMFDIDGIVSFGAADKFGMQSAGGGIIMGGQVAGNRKWIGSRDASGQLDILTTGALPIVIWTGGAELFRFEAGTTAYFAANARLGFGGTPSTNLLLDVGLCANTDAADEVGIDTAGGDMIFGGISSGSRKWFGTRHGSGQLDILTIHNVPIVFWTNSVERFRITGAGNIEVSDGLQFGRAAGPLLTFDDTNNYLEITGCNVGIGSTTPGHIVEVRETIAWGLSTQDTVVLKPAFSGGSSANPSSYGSYAWKSGTTILARIQFVQENPAGAWGGHMSFWTIDDTPTLNENMRIDKNGGVFMYNLKSGATQGAAGAAVDELWHDTDDDSIKIGV